MRKKELYKSAHVLGIASSHVIIVNDSNLPDDPKCAWDFNVINKIISETITRFKIDVVMIGVSCQWLQSSYGSLVCV